MGSVLRRIFAPAHDVTVVLHGRQALAALEGDADFDVVLCDVVMPELTGPQVYEVVCERRPDLAARFVFLTGGAVQERNRAFLAAHASHVLYKPFELSAVRDIVSRVIAQAA